VKRLLLAVFLSMILHTLLISVPREPPRKGIEPPIAPRQITLSLTPFSMPQVPDPAQSPQAAEEEMIPQGNLIPGALDHRREEAIPEKKPIPEPMKMPPPKKRVAAPAKKKTPIIFEERAAISDQNEAPLLEAAKDQGLLVENTEAIPIEGAGAPFGNPSKGQDIFSGGLSKAAPPGYASTGAIGGAALSSPPSTNLQEKTPLYRKNPRPDYPRTARERGYEGTAIIEVLVNREGRVKHQRLLTSSGYPILDRAAMAAVKDWLFESASRGEEKIEMWVKVPVRFELK
jgi:periplasmic protein TonB